VTSLQFLTVIGFVVVGVAIIPWSVERAVDKRWKEIREMFDRALMHGGSLDTLGKALKATSEESRVKADGAVKAVDLLHELVKRQESRLAALEDHPVLRKVGGNGDKR